MACGGGLPSATVTAQVPAPPSSGTAVTGLSSLPTSCSPVTCSVHWVPPVTGLTLTVPNCVPGVEAIGLPGATVASCSPVLVFLGGGRGCPFVDRDGALRSFGDYPTAGLLGGEASLIPINLVGLSAPDPGQRSSAGSSPR